MKSLLVFLFFILNGTLFAARDTIFIIQAPSTDVLAAKLVCIDTVARVFMRSNNPELERFVRLKGSERCYGIESQKKYSPKKDFLWSSMIMIHIFEYSDLMPDTLNSPFDIPICYHDYQSLVRPYTGFHRTSKLFRQYSKLNGIMSDLKPFFLNQKDCFYPGMQLKYLDVLLILNRIEMSLKEEEPNFDNVLDTIISQTESDTVVVAYYSINKKGNLVLDEIENK
ncbi:hypothetical protein KFE98_01585 [bacterium SCSIO 12741]|nr:hypothetical protein KFE98_01585 [bacterium SCSIO 12741]